MTDPRVTRAAWISLMILAVVWSFGWTMMKVATHYSGPFTFIEQRYIVGTLGLFLWLIARREDLRPTPWLPTIAIGLSQTLTFQALSQWALMSGGAGKTSLLAYTMPFWVVPLAWWWVHEKPGWMHWLCIAVAAVGFVCVVRPWRPLGTPHSIALAILAGFFWAVATVLSKRAFQRHPEVTPIRLTAWQMLIGTLGLIILASLTPEHPVVWAWPYVGALLYTGLMSTSMGWVLWAFVIKTLSADVAGLTSLAVPIGSVLFAWGLLQEAPSGMEWIGIALIGGALLTLNFARRVAA